MDSTQSNQVSPMPRRNASGPFPSHCQTWRKLSANHHFQGCTSSQSIFGERNQWSIEKNLKLRFPSHNHFQQIACAVVKAYMSSALKTNQHCTSQLTFREQWYCGWFSLFATSFSASDNTEPIIRMRWSEPGRLVHVAIGVGGFDIWFIRLKCVKFYSPGAF